MYTAQQELETVNFDRLGISEADLQTASLIFGESFMQDLPSRRTNLTLAPASANIDKLAPKVNAR